MLSSKMLRSDGPTNQPMDQRTNQWTVERETMSLELQVKFCFHAERERGCFHTERERGFLDAPLHLYKRVCPSVHLSGRWSVSHT